MLPFELSFPTRILFGTGEIAKVGQEAKSLGQKALLVTGGSSAKRTGLLDRVQAFLNEQHVSHVLFDKIEPNPRTSTVDQGASLAREHGCDFIIALGGGSVMDASKAIAAAALSGRPIYDYMRGNPSGTAKDLVPVQEALPLMAIPTVAATGSEANNISVLTHWDTHEKSSINGPALYPRVAILDPALTYTVPAHVTAEACADIFSHMFESYLISAPGTHVQDGITESLIRLVVEHSLTAIRQPDHEEARATLLWASTLGISPFAIGGRGAGMPLHQIEHPLSGHYDMAHGRGLAILSLPYFEQIILQDRPERLARMGRECFGVSETDELAAARAAIKAVQRWYEAMGITQRLSDFGVDKHALEELARESIVIGGRGAGYLPSSRPLSEQDVISIYEACL
ncbi:MULTISPECIES: iron-containing alcohol dehydrogenase [Brevibacillus]|uniref:NADH-dependent butanol dehydrogenase n=1 Tax=Brevibacillus borstelensis AK1 TaxID=1300222 RepID=M8D6H1_9BACL|nr:iron-containing alcohol dehydrogenase [Brevibacillus borstelensis]EMT51869.1 NADH-dependent butanol dehydrogenase [Brevibacillus borstelensis AK1]KKX56066.1 butanol dehydrogenase [Brevibacillus borstelensis cifa_chp40]MBE5398414.1 iron-containing alcohol dehydrogenase [Brevibacillus borstelensis]MCC0565886.1 iron-containing alcohol dehydrogenase [Brevibacillus borstelensis]MCM3471100.1 iron-containing alcohol dehydrogenase [Brevibacillus borstelensis]